MPKGFSQREKELIASRLLEHGARLFSTHGLQKTNVEEIARAAGISKGAFYIFYESKEALFMSVIEQMETRLRQDILAAIERPGPTPRARLLAVLKQGIDAIQSLPLTRFLIGTDYDLLFRRLPAGRFQQHLVADLAFFDVVIARCREAGIPIRAQPEQIVSALYPLVMSALRADEAGLGAFSGSIDLLLELVAAFCLGEVELAQGSNTNDLSH